MLWCWQSIKNISKYPSMNNTFRNIVTLQVETLHREVFQANAAKLAAFESDKPRLKGFLNALNQQRAQLKKELTQLQAAASSAASAAPLQMKGDSLTPLNWKQCNSLEKRIRSDAMPCSYRQLCAILLVTTFLTALARSTKTLSDHQAHTSQSARLPRVTMLDFVMRCLTIGTHVDGSIKAVETYLPWSSLAMLKGSQK